MIYDLSNIVCIKSTKTTYRDGDYLIKIYEDNIETSKILNAGLNQQRVSECTDLNIPKLIEVTKINGKWAIVMEYVDGVNLEQYLETHEDQLDDILDILIATQIKILGNRVPLLQRTKDIYAYKLSKTNEIDENKRKELLKQLDNERNHSKLCHGDISLSNIVVKNDGSIWVLDWNHASQGNAETDAARTYLTMSLKNKEMAEKYLDKFTEQTKITKESIKKWLPIIAGAELKINKETKNYVDLVDYE